MKKLLALLLILALSISVFASCGLFASDDTTNDDGANDGTQNNDGTNTTPETTPLENALEYIHQLYKDMALVTGADYDLLKVVSSGGESFTVTWTVSDSRITIVDKDDSLVTVVIPESDEDITYTLKAVVTAADGSYLEKEYSHKVNKFAYTSYADYAAAEDDAPIAVLGVVTGIVSKSAGSNTNALYLQNDDGGYYVYGLTDDPLTTGITVGMTVKVKGSKDNYNGTLEIVSATVEIVDSTITTVTPANYTEILSAAASLSDESLVYKQAILVTIDGVTIKEPGDNGYYYFELGSHKVYLRISSSANPTDSASLATIKENHAANYGNLATVTGVVSIYGGNFYITPVSADAFSNFTMPERNDAEKVAFELEALATVVPTEINSDGSITLAVAGSTYDTVSIAWSSESEQLTIEGGTITIVIPDTATDVVLTATATCGDESATKDFTIKLNKTVTSIADLIAIGNTYEKDNYTDSKYITAGIITEVQNAKYGNVVISDGANSILIYGLYTADGVRYDSMTNAPQVGDYVMVLGIVGMYNAPQMKNATLLSQASPITIEAALEEGAKYTKNNYSTDKFLVSGTITEVQNATYGNVVISDGTNSILVYGLYTHNNVRYGSMSVQPGVGEKITVYGVIGMYNAAQLKNATLVSHDPHVHTYETLANKCDGCGEISEHTCVNENDTEDAFCDLCGELVEHTCVNANDTEDAFCDLCGAVLAHTCVDANSDSKCDLCGDDYVELSGTTLAVFEFGSDVDTTTHADGSEMGESTCTYTSGSYTLTLTGYSKVYTGANDATGNSCLKLGTSKLAGSFSFTVADDVASVKIYIAGYKKNTASVTINGADYTISKLSDNGEYTCIEIDTTTTKTVTLTTTSTAYRAMIDTIEYHKAS